MSRYAPTSSSGSPALARRRNPSSLSELVGPVEVVQQDHQRRPAGPSEEGAADDIVEVDVGLAGVARGASTVQEMPGKAFLESTNTNVIQVAQSAQAAQSA